MADKPKGIYRFISLLLDRDSVRASMRAAEEALTGAGEDGGKSFIRQLKQQFDRGMADLRMKLATGVIDKRKFQQEADELARVYNTKLGFALQKLRAEGKLTDDQFATLGKRMKRVGDDGASAGDRISRAWKAAVAFIAGSYLVRQIWNFGKASITAAGEAESAWNHLAGTMKTAGMSFDAERGRIQMLSKRWQDTTRHDDEAYAATLDRLIQLTGNYRLSLSNVGLVANVAARYFKNDLAPATDLVGRLLTGQTRVLREVGIVTKDAQEGYRVLAERSMGQAEQATKDFSGQTAQLANVWSDFKEELGGALIEGGRGASIIDILKQAVKDLTAWVRQNTPELKAMAQALFGVAGAAGKAVSAILWLRNPAGAQAGQDIEAIQRQAGFGNKAWMEARLGVEQRNLAGIIGQIAGLGNPEQDLQNFMAHGRGDQIPMWIARSVDRLDELRDHAEAARQVIAFLQQQLAAGAPGGAPPPQGPPPTPGKPEKKFVLDYATRLKWQGRYSDTTKFGKIPSIGATGQGGLIASADLAQQKVALETLTDYYRTAFGIIQSVAENAASGWSGAWQDAFSVLFAEGATAGKFFETLGRGIAGSLLGGIAQYASGKVSENIAAAIEEVAKGFAASADPFFAWSAPLHFKAAAQHGVAAAAWGILAGGAGAGQAAVTGGGRGGRSGGIPSGATDIGGRLAEKTPGPQIVIVIDPLNPSNPVYQANVHAAEEWAKRRFPAGTSPALIVPRTGSGL